MTNPETPGIFSQTYKHIHKRYFYMRGIFCEKWSGSKYIFYSIRVTTEKKILSPQNDGKWIKKN